MFMATLPAISAKSFNLNYVDGVFAVWLIIGIFRGRKRGMTQELLPTLKWLGVVILAGLFYQPVSGLLFKYANGVFTHLTCNIIGYLLIAFAVNLIFLSVKQGIGEKLVGSDYFGRAEYYLGMMSGLIRFGCMIIVLCALMNSRIYTDAELSDMAKFQKKNFEDISFPTYGSIQHSVLKESFTGPFIREHLYKVMIASATDTNNKPPETIGKKREEQINSILGPAKK